MTTPPRPGLPGHSVDQRAITRVALRDLASHAGDVIQNALEEPVTCRIPIEPDTPEPRRPL